MKLIKLTQGQFAKVDDEDYDCLNKFKWQAQRDGDKYYARRTIRAYSKRIAQQMHRMIAGFPDKEMEIDHIDHDTLNNQRHNLRIATKSQNQANRTCKKCSLSRYRGVSKYRNKWVAEVQANGIKYYLGLFNDEKEAAIKYNTKAAEVYGEYANLNVI